MTHEDTPDDKLLEARLRRHFVETSQLKPPYINSFWLAEQAHAAKQQQQITLVAVASGLWFLALFVLILLLLHLNLMLLALSAISFMIAQGVSSGVFAWFYFYSKLRIENRN